MKNKTAYFLLGLAIISILQAVVIAQPAKGQCIEPVQQQELTSTAAIETIITDNSYHHLGNDFKEELTPKEPEGVIYAKTFVLDSGFESPELVLMANSVSPYEINSTEYMDRVYINDVEVTLLNCYFKPPPVSLFSIDTKLEDDLNKGVVSDELKNRFKNNGFPLSNDAFIIPSKGENIWTISDPSSSQKLIVIKERGMLDVYPPAYSREVPGPAEVDISLDPGLLKIGNNTIKITSGSNKDRSNYDDFGFSQLTLKGIRKTGWVLSGRVLFDDESARAGVSIYRHGTDELVSHSDTDAEGLYSLKLSNGKYDVKVESGSDMRYISPDSKTITIDNSNISLDFKTSMPIATFPTVLGLLIIPFLMPSIAAGFIVAIFAYLYTKKRKIAVLGFVSGTVSTCIINLLMISFAGLSSSIFQSSLLGIPLIITSSLLLSAGITFILVAVPIILLNRGKVS
ncbi:MAG: hypothetical protein O8C64_03125 [Candidatus Methanoperedens sp.]|nr:hypothetical protein [Candidatus Methanoperedens sp.]MCZ7406230.1 hypothetical protein [Candidatus Methanoperedens sp.]